MGLQAKFGEHARVVNFCECCRVKRPIFPLTVYERKEESYGLAYRARLRKGGKRLGADRPKGTGNYGEPTVPMRVPISVATEILEVIEMGGRARPAYIVR